MKLTIELSNDHITKCCKFASMRRTLNEAVRIITDSLDQEASMNIAELEAIIPTIEAMQMAVREANKIIERNERISNYRA